VFLIDVSGSMGDADKLPLVKSALIMLSDSLREDDKISIVVYAGASGVVLKGSSGSDTRTIEKALNSLKSGGSTAGGAGIELAYDIAEHYFIENGNNRVILCTDGDFNVGPSSLSELENLIEQKRRSGVFLSVLGFGEGNLKDTTMETLADKGNGNYAYIDSLMEAKKVLVNELMSTLYTVAKDVKIQVEFNPAAVEAYRLIGYDNRRLNAQDFNDDKKDAGEMGAGHTVTVFYEISLLGSGGIDNLIFQDNDTSSSAKPASDWMYVKTRYKLPDENESRLMTKMAGEYDFTAYPDDDFRFASAVAEFALILKNSQYKGDANFSSLIDRARDSRGDDNDGYRSQFLQLADLAHAMYR
jgi:Ca-activated chloride channel family protein